MFIFLKKFLCNVYIYMYRETDIYIYMVKNVYIDITVHVHVCAFLYKMYIYFRYKRTTEVHTHWAESAYTLAQKCMSF